MWFVTGDSCYPFWYPSSDCVALPKANNWPSLFPQLQTFTFKRRIVDCISLLTSSQKERQSNHLFSTDRFGCFRSMFIEELGRALSLSTVLSIYHVREVWFFVWTMHLIKGGGTGLSLWGVCLKCVENAMREWLKLVPKPWKVHPRVELRRWSINNRATPLAKQFC